MATATTVELPLIEESESQRPVEVGAPPLVEAAAVAVEETELDDAGGLVSTVSSELIASIPSGDGEGSHVAGSPAEAGAGSVVTEPAPVTPRGMRPGSFGFFASPPATPKNKGPTTSPGASPMSAEMAVIMEAMQAQMAQSQAQLAQTQMMMQLMIEQRQADERRYQEERRSDLLERRRLEEATLAAAEAATSVAESMSCAAEHVSHADTEDKVEVVKTTAALPKLEAATVAEPAVRCGDWLVRATMVIGSYSETASAWWSHVRGRAQEA